MFLSHKIFVTSCLRSIALMSRNCGMSLLCLQDGATSVNHSTGSMFKTVLLKSVLSYGDSHLLKI